jgi:UDP-N-acetylmuramate dehydrogenase
LANTLSPNEALKPISKEALKFSYRKNHFLMSHHLVYSCVWRSEKDDPEQIKTRFKEVLDRRKKSQPLDYPSCGSVFKNPKSTIEHAWSVIDRLGLRGYRIGNAQFSEKHPNFIINLGGASARDVYQLIQLAKTRAAKELSIQLEEEVRLLGLFAETTL